MTRAYILHPELTSLADRRAAGPALNEALALAAALPDLDIRGGEIVRLARPHPGRLFGDGKLEELHDKFAADNIDLVLIDGPVTPVQQRNLEKAWDVKLLDRTGLIIEIFSDRARTREGELQVEMAALSYQRTRLVRAWTHLERQRGGLGFVGGPGETQIEADRRAIDTQLTRLRRQLDKVVKTRALHRAARAKVPFPIVALVGYTNAGKSTLFNRLTGAQVLAKDMLFATLDPTMRAMSLPFGKKIILSDTVGFISDLPPQLVAAFRATLEEVLAADLILHVRDIADPDSDAQAQDVMTILEDMGVENENPIVEIWNKRDLLSPEQLVACQSIADRRDDVVLISAQNGTDCDGLLERIETLIDDPRQCEEVALALADGRLRAWLYAQEVVQNELQRDDQSILVVNWTARQSQEFRKLQAQAGS